MRKSQIDLPGAAGLLVIAMILAGNQIVMKLTATGLSPVFQAGGRSILAFLVILGWVLLRGVRPGSFRRYFWPGVLLGVLFTAEFIGLYIALDLTEVSRASIIFYTMPMFLSLGAHLLIPDDRLTPVQVAGLVCAFLGVAIVLSDRGGGEASLAGDLLALMGSVCWAGIALTVRVSRISDAPPEAHQLWQLGVSALLLPALAPLFGPLVRDFGTEHVWLMAYQVLLVASFGFLFWFYLLKVYPASSVASFAFLTPVLSVFMGWAILGERLHLSGLVSLALVSAGIVLINRRSR